MMSDDGFRQTEVTEGVKTRLGPYHEGDDSAPFTVGNLEPNTAEYVNRRDDIQGYLKNVSDRNCNLFKSNTLSRQATVNFGLESTALLFSGLGGLLSPESTAQALSGASALTTGVSEKVGSNFYREKTVEILTKAIQTKRDALWADIKAKQALAKAGGTETYRINEAIADVVEYNNSCGLVTGFEEMLSAVNSREIAVEAAKVDQKGTKNTLTISEIIATTDKN
jgi:hypothetical protein